jgi:hypothetical protein
MPKEHQGQKTTPPKSKKPPRQRPEDAVSRAVYRQPSDAMGALILIAGILCALLLVVGALGVA